MHVLVYLFNGHCLGRTPLVLAGVDNKFVTKLLEAGGDPTIATYDGGFMTNDKDVGKMQCRGRSIDKDFSKIYLLYIFFFK